MSTYIKKTKKFLGKLGPGFTTGASDDDPSGIITYAQTGALFGYKQLWTALFTFPLMTSVQEMSGRIGMVTGRGLASVIRSYYPKYILWISITLLLVANTINIGADLGAIASLISKLTNFNSFLVLGVIVLITIGLEVFVKYKTYSKYLKFLGLFLVAYIFSVLLVDVDWKLAFASTIVPHLEFSRSFVMNIVAIFGTTISPYLFFWQANQEVEEEIADHKIKGFETSRPVITKENMKTLKIDTGIGMLFSNIIMWFIIILFGTTLYDKGITQITNADQAALALKPLAGNFSFVLFSLGIIGTGFLAIPVLAGSASYAVSEMFHWHEGLSLRLKKAYGFYAVIAISTIIGSVINTLGINPIKLLYYTAVINGLISPILLIIILFIANNKKVMGEHVNSKYSNITGIITVFIMGAFSLLLIYDFIKNL